MLDFGAPIHLVVFEGGSDNNFLSLSEIDKTSYWGLGGATLSLLKQDLKKEQIL